VCVEQVFAPMANNDWLGYSYLININIKMVCSGYSYYELAI